MLTVVWDVDDVLNDLMYQWFTRAWMAEHPNCRLSYADLSDNPPHLALGVDREEYLTSMDAFRRTTEATNLEPNIEVLSWFREHGGHFRHVALTARPLETAADVAHWVVHHFGTWIRCFGFVPTRVGEGVPIYDRDKGEYLHWLGRGHVLVDDTLENIRQAKALGLKTLVYAQPWNRSVYTTTMLLQELTDMAEAS